MKTTKTVSKTVSKKVAVVPAKAAKSISSFTIHSGNVAGIDIATFNKVRNRTLSIIRLFVPDIGDYVSDDESTNFTLRALRGGKQVEIILSDVYNDDYTEHKLVVNSELYTSRNWYTIARKESKKANEEYALAESLRKSEVEKAEFANVTARYNQLLAKYGPIAQPVDIKAGAVSTPDTNDDTDSGDSTGDRTDDSDDTNW